ncbi:MAG: hypothetical protein AAFQ98_03350 [Bacteroidota bacterium]
MPAKTKYLSSGWTRFSKVMAAILGSYIVTMLIHMAVAKMPADDTPVVLTTAYSSFLMWIGFMVLAFFIRKAWHVWGLFALLSGLCTCLIVLL